MEINGVTMTIRDVDYDPNFLVLYPEELVRVRPEGCLCEYRLDSHGGLRRVSVRVRNPPCPVLVHTQQNGTNPQDVWQAPSGARSSGQFPHYYRIPFHIFTPRLGARYQLGEEGKYATPDGETPNWKTGIHDRTFILDRLNHLIHHVHLVAEEIRYKKRAPDDNLAAVMWNAIFLMAAQDATEDAQKPFKRHALSCPAYGNYQPPYETCTCGAEEA